MDRTQILQTIRRAQGTKTTLKIPLNGGKFQPVWMNRHRSPRGPSRRNTVEEIDRSRLPSIFGSYTYTHLSVLLGLLIGAKRGKGPWGKAQNPWWLEDQAGSFEKQPATNDVIGLTHNSANVVISAVGKILRKRNRIEDPDPTIMDLTHHASRITDPGITKRVSNHGSQMRICDPLILFSDPSKM